MPRFVTVDVILRAKSRWRVAAMAMAYRLHSLTILSEWQYKSACIELGKRGYRTGEPGGLDRETSLVWRKVLDSLWSERVTKNEIARELRIPLDELEGLVWGLVGQRQTPKISGTPLRIV
jgi:Zn-dependent peptidase ImmA (M78 family)